jgi:hypothetical protein
MPMKPVWVLNILSFDGVWENTLARLYAIFEQDFIQTHRYFEHRPVIWDDRKLDGRYEEGFWHVISIKDQETGERIPDYERAKRLPWCAPTITNSDDITVKCWDYQESRGEIRTYLWLEQWDYVVILEKKTTGTGDIAILITAYHVGGSSTRRKLTLKYEQRVI